MGRAVVKRPMRRLLSSAVAASAVAALTAGVVWQRLAGPDRDIDPGDAQPLAASELARLRGQWRGADIATGAMWTFSFGDEHLVVARSDAGEWYQGLAVFHTAMGRERDGTIRVPPGSGVLDVDVTLASSAALVGKPSLGTYFEVGPRELKLCASRPGVERRATSYEATVSGILCFRLSKLSDEPGGGRGERPPR